LFSEGVVSSSYALFLYFLVDLEDKLVLLALCLSEEFSTKEVLGSVKMLGESRDRL
jgi:hypothetical protein